MSFVAAIPAAGLLTAIVMNGMAHGSEMFSGLMTAIVVVTGLLVLVLSLSPFVLMALYPAEGFAALAPPPAATPQPSGADEDEDDEFDEDEGFEDDEADDEYGDLDEGGGGEELFEDGYDDEEFDDGLGDFEDDDEEWG